MAFRGSRKKAIVATSQKRVDWVFCRYCGKSKIAENALSAGEGQRWYCSEQHLNIGEREFKGRSK